MAYLIDPPSTLGNNTQEGFNRNMMEYCRRLTDSLNRELNNLSVKNMDKDTAAAISGSGSARITALQTKLTGLEQDMVNLRALVAELQEQITTLTEEGGGK